jgi:hypothetical protein
MRKVALLTAVTAMSFGAVQVAQAVDVNQGLSVKVTGKKGTKTKPKNVKLTVVTTTNAKDPALDGTYGTTKAVIHFDKNLKFNALDKKLKWPTCTEAVVNATPNESGCAKGSKVSVDTGSAAKAQGGTGAGAIKANPAIRAYNGGNGTFILKLVSPPGEFDATGTIVAKVSKDTGKYGYKLTVPIPEKYYNQFGIKITLQRFATVVAGSYKTKSYVQSIGCTGGKYNFGGDFTFTDGTKASVKTTAKC